MKFIIVANEFFNIYNFRIHLIHDILKNFNNTKIILVGNFDGFKKSAKSNEKAAEALKVAAQENNIEELNKLFDVLSKTCKSCHRSYKN